MMKEMRFWLLLSALTLAAQDSPAVFDTRQRSRAHRQHVAHDGQDPPHQVGVEPARSWLANPAASVTGNWQVKFWQT